ncbi:MAG TPA: hypothetical protein VHO23_01125 [Candidatus Paceibacterota bacterium]|nr:hypothetical protein [Candidatus Paceibacterota bacterium]
MFRTVLLLLLGVFAFAPLASAQIIGADPLTASISPQYPRPYQTVTIAPISTLIDLSASTVTVSANGTVVGKGSGAQKVNVTLGGPGTRTAVRITVTDPGGSTYTEDLSIRPADAALIVEPSTTVHPFYQGGSLVASEGSLRVIALPDIRTAPGTRINPASLVYTWKLGDQVLQAQSGVGKSTLQAVAPPRYRDALLTLTVATVDNAIVAQTSTSIAASEPVVRIYERDPLLGPLFNRAISGTFVMSEDEQAFRAVPYFFASAPAIAWSVNNAPSGADKDITLRASGGGGGTANVSVRANQPANYQSATAALKVEFDSDAGLGIFGL